MKGFKYVSLFLVLVMIVSLFAGCSNNQGTAPGQKTTVFKLANASAIGDDRDQSLQVFAKLVDEKSKGSMKVEVYSGGLLGAWRDTIEGLEPGIVQIVCESIGTLEPFSPTSSIDAFPYLYTDYDSYGTIMNGEIGRDLLDIVGKEGHFVLMGPSYRGVRVMMSNKKIESVSDLKGLKIRAPGLQIYIKTWEYLGASPIPMDPSEIYTGLQQGTIDAEENPIMFNYGMAYYDVCKYMIMTNHVMSTDVFIFNDKFFNGLPADQQQVFKDAAKEAAEFRTNLVLDEEKATIEKMKEKGVEVIYPDLAPFRAKLIGFEKEFPQIKDLVDKIHLVK